MDFTETDPFNAVDPFGAVEPFGADRDPFSTALDPFDRDYGPDPETDTDDADWPVFDAWPQARETTAHFAKVLRALDETAAQPKSKPQPNSGSPSSSEPLYSTEVGPLLLTVIRAGWRGYDSYQVYAVEAGNWSLVGLFGLYVDALSEVAVWRNYVDAGGSLSAWTAAHPDGVRGGAR